MKSNLFKTALTAAIVAITFLPPSTFGRIPDPYPGFSADPVINFNDLRVYPNPVAGNTRIVLPQASSYWVYVSVTDMNGVLTRSFQYQPGTCELNVDMSRLPAGSYCVRVVGYEVGFHNLRVLKE